MMAQFFTFLSAIVRRWSYRRRVLLLLACLSLGLSVLLSNGLAQASMQPPRYAQNQADVWATVANARQSYKDSQYENAKSAWQAAVNSFTKQGDHLNQAMALSNLSLTHQALGEWLAAETAIEQSLEILDNPAQPRQVDRTRVLAQSLDVRGNLAFINGQPETALRDWQHSEQLYASINDKQKFASSLLNQVQAYQLMGQYLQAERQLTQVQEQIEQVDDLTKFFVGRSLANSQRLLGNLSEANKILQQLLGSQELSAADLAVLYNDLGNVQVAIAQRAKDLGKPNKKIHEPAHKAWVAYKQAIELTVQPTQRVLHLQAQVNALSLLTRFQPWLENTGILQENYILEQSLDRLLASDTLPVGRDTVYGRINYAESLIHLAQISDNPDELYQKAAQLLGQAVWLTENQLHDQRTRSYATGRLGALYVETHQLTTAHPLLEQAVLIAENANAPDISYRWQRQLGKLLEIQANEQESLGQTSTAQALKEKSIVAYRSALNTLKKVRNDLLTVNSEVQFSFRDEVEPVYREFIELLLKTADENTKTGQERLREALGSFDSLQLAEINNFLGCDSGQRIQLETVNDPKAAIIYAMILDENIAVIVDLPGVENLKPYQLSREISISDDELTGDVLEGIHVLRKGLENAGEMCSNCPGGKAARSLYRGLIEPLNPALEQIADLDTLVFVLDGELRNIPMAVLDNGQQFLVDRYNIALNPRIELFKPQPLTEKFRLLLGGVSEQPQKPDIPQLEDIRFLKDELLGIQAYYDDSYVLLDSDFKSQKIGQQLVSNDFSAVHFKTHGKFSSDPGDTFILGYGERIDGKKLGDLIQTGTVGDIKIIDLLSLSTCHSARGDNRAVLGLTGIAVRAGARTAISSLWEAQDEYTTQFMLHFYEKLTEEGVTRAKAFADAQRALIATEPDPYVWAPYVLVGNWQ